MTQIIQGVQKWECRITWVRGDYNAVQVELDKFGEAGWELVAVENDPPRTVLYFKRPKQ